MIARLLLHEIATYSVYVLITFRSVCFIFVRMEKGEKKLYGISESTKKKLKEVYTREIINKSENELNLEGLRRLLIDFDIDESFAEPMFRIIAGWDNSEVLSFDKFVEFFTTMQKKDLNAFYQLLFRAIDTDGDSTISPQDLVAFSKIV